MFDGFWGFIFGFVAGFFITVAATMFIQDVKYYEGYFVCQSLTQSKCEKTWRPVNQPPESKGEE